MAPAAVRCSRRIVIALRRPTRVRQVQCDEMEEVESRSKIRRETEIEIEMAREEEEVDDKATGCRRQRNSK